MICCPRCGGTTKVVVSADFRFSSVGSTEVRECQKCGYCFEHDDGFTG